MKKNNNDKSFMSIEEKHLLEIEALLTKPGKCKCGNDFEYEGLGTYRCQRCMDVYKNEYAIIRDFVDEYGTNYSIYEISRMTNVSKRLIDLFIKDGRFEAVKKQPKCRNCKAIIERGMYCNRCALLQIDGEIKRTRHVSGRIKEDNSMKGEMRYLDKDFE